MGLDNSEKITYLTVRHGALCHGNGDNEVKYEFVSGVLAELNTYVKPIKNKPDKHVVVIRLIDGEDTFSIESGCRHANGVTTFARMVAGYLHLISAGEEIQIRVKPNDRTPESVSCFVATKQTGEWKTPDGYKSFKGEGEDAVKAIETHQAWKKREAKPATEPEDHGDPNAGAYKRGSAEELGFIAYVEANKWPIFAPNEGAYEAWFAFAMQQPVWRCGDTNPATWLFFRQCAEKCVAAARVPKLILEKATVKPFDPMAEDGPPEQQSPPIFDPAAEDSEPENKPVQTSAVVPNIDAATAPVVDSGFNHNAWVCIGYTPPRLPPKDRFNLAATVDHLAALARVAHGKFPKGKRMAATNVLLSGFGIDEKRRPSAGAVLLVYDFVSTASAQQLGQLLERAEHDPFEEDDTKPI